MLAATAVAAVNPHLKQVRTVYILSMGSGMDQYLANRLTTLGVFQVVADPQKADAVITDRIGEPFEAKLKEIYPPPPPPHVAAPPKDEKADKDAKDDKDSKSAKDDKAKDEKKDEADTRPRVSSFNRGRGNFFIVDRKSHNVIWSVYERPKDSTPSELNKTADRVVKRLKNDIIDKKGPGE